MTALRGSAGDSGPRSVPGTWGIARRDVEMGDDGVARIGGVKRAAGDAGDAAIGPGAEILAAGEGLIGSDLETGDARGAGVVHSWPSRPEDRPSRGLASARGC